MSLRIITKIVIMAAGFILPITSWASQQDDVKYFAKQAALSLYHFDATTAEKHLEEISQSFDAKAWQQFFGQLKASGNINAIKKQGLFVRSEPRKPMKIKKIDPSHWQVVQPIHAAFFGRQYVRSQMLNITMDISMIQKVYRITNIDIQLTQPMIITPRMALQSRHCPLIQKNTIY